MSYIIYTNSGTVLTTVATGKLNTNTVSISLVGRNTPNYGQYFNQNFVDILTNFASPSYVPPQYPIEGQLWYDTTSHRLKIYTVADGFKIVNSPVISTTQPIGQLPGEFWYDPDSEKLNFLNEDGQYVSMTTFPINDDSGWVHSHTPILDSNTNTTKTTLLKNYGDVVGALTTSGFTASFADSTGEFLRANTSSFKVAAGLTIIGDIKATGNIEATTLTIDGENSSLDNTSDNAAYVKGGVGIDKDLLVNGSALIRGNLKVDGIQTIINSTVTTIVDPVIDIGTGIDNAPLTAADIFDKGLLIHYNFSGGTENDNHAFVGYEHNRGRFMLKDNIYPGGVTTVPVDDIINTGTWSALDLAEVSLYGTDTTVTLNVGDSGFTISSTAFSPPLLPELLRTAPIEAQNWMFGNDGSFTSPGNITAPYTYSELVGNAATASKWKEPITLTLGGSLSGSVVIDGSQDIGITATFTGTTYYAGTGLTLSDTTFNHSNSVTAGTASEGGSNRTLGYSETFTVPSITYDAQGHITGTGSTTLTMPAASSITSATIITALGYTPYNASNPAGYLSSINSSLVTTALGYTPYNASNPAGYLSSINSSLVTTALGYTPYNASNPNSYISASSNQNTQVYSLGVGTGASGTEGEIRATDNITGYYSSDAKFKENIRTIPNALDTVVAIGGKLFDWTDEYINDKGGEDGYFIQKSDFGVIAQDVEQVFPQAVHKRPDGTLAVDYHKLSALAFAAIVELKAEVDRLKGQ
jgi:Chaperone of endosialidase